MAIGRTAELSPGTPKSASFWAMLILRLTRRVRASITSNTRSPLPASSEGSSVSVKTVPMLPWKIVLPSFE